MRTAAAPLLVLLVVGGLLLLAAGGGAAAPAAPDVRVDLDEWTLTASTRSVPAGPVSFSSRNSGGVDHELLVVRTELGADQLGDAQYAGIHVLGTPHDHFGATVADLRSRHLKPGRSRREVVALEPGRYVLYCGLPGHYERGQRAAFTVTR